MKSVYADCNATTPCSTEHYKKVLKLLERASANPSSIHRQGREAKLLLEDSRQNVASLFGADKNTLLFTSGATESNNMVLQGHVFDRYKSGKKAKLLLSSTEHASIYQTAEILKKRGLCELVYAPVNRFGVIDFEGFSKLLTEDLSLVCLIHVNNETGAINPIFELVSLIRKERPDVHIHVDAVQSYGKIDIRSFATSSIDTAAASAHKMGGFKGVGCLYHKPSVKLRPLLYGGPQERSWRAGTENLPGILSFGIRAAELSHGEWAPQVPSLRAHFLQGLSNIPELILHSDAKHCLPNTVNFHIEGIRGEELLFSFDSAGISVSGGSACSSGGGRPSPVLKAMGYSDEVAANSIRVSFGEHTQKQDVDHILKTLLDLTCWKKRSNRVV
jgi:cysteine desulfurase